MLRFLLYGNLGQITSGCVCVHICLSEVYMQINILSKEMYPDNKQTRQHS